MAKEYFKDIEDEQMYLEMLEEIDFDTAMDIYTDVKDEAITSYLSSRSRGRTFEELTYKNLRYLILGCENCKAEMRVKALATFIYRASLPIRLNALVSNQKLLDMLHKNMEESMPKIYTMSGLKYEQP